MENIREKALAAFPRSRKLKDVHPSEAQMNNVEYRLRQIFSEEELASMDENRMVRQVERVWPIAQYVDRK
jgi:hypothetical protein